MPVVKPTANEAELVGLALHATAVQVERIVRVYRGVRDDEEATAATNRQHAERYVHLDSNHDGTVATHGRRPAEAAAIVRAALEAAPRDDPAGPAATTNAQVSRSGRRA